MVTSRPLTIPGLHEARCVITLQLQPVPESEAAGRHGQ
jgi:hypothetical protein